MEKEKIENVIGKIAAIRMKKGYTYENRTHELSITPAAYRKIEIGETKLTVERLFRISEILNASLPDLLEITDRFQQTNNDSATGYQQKIEKIENFFQENKEIAQNLVSSLKDEIAHLNGEIEFLREMVKKQ